MPEKSVCTYVIILEVVMAEEVLTVSFGIAMYREVLFIWIKCLQDKIMLSDAQLKQYGDTATI